MSGPWGKSNIGNWAAETELAEAEEREAAAAAAAAGPTDAQSFPSLREAATAKPKKKKMTLSEFYVSGGGGGVATTRLTPDEMMRLPTGPKERSAEEMQFGRLGGGFSSYGRDRGPPNRTREDSDGSWGGGGGGRRSYGGFDDDRRGPSPRVSEFDQPSRADEADNWASAKKSLPSFDSGRQNRYSSLGGGGGGGGGGDMGAYGSRADDADNWAMGKKPLPARSSSTFGSGFRDSGTEPDRWSRGGMREPMREPERERPRLVLDPRKSDAGVNEPGKVNKSNPFGAARPREEVLAEKGLDWKKLESELEAKKTSRPTSAHSSRPSSAQSSRSESQSLHGIENVIKQKPKVNPFGDAKPREVLLEEKGLDWRKIDLDLEHKAIERPETEEEKLLKNELDDLKKQLEKDPNVQELILEKEKELELFVRDLDDKVRFGQKAVDRPGSGSGRATGFADRPPSQSGSHEEYEYADRPRSRGTGNAWARPGEDRRGGFQGGRERVFLGNRDMDSRPRSRERW